MAFIKELFLMKVKTLIRVIMVLLVLIVLATLGFYVGKTDSDYDSELVLVHVIFRHGARTPSSFYPNDPNKNETFYPFGFGQLTTKGKQGEYELGQLLRKEYGEFLGKDFTNELVYVRSTDFTRTRMSALLVLAGLFPPSENLVWNKDLLWLPIPVDYVPYAKEDLLHPEASCPFKSDFLDKQPNNAEAREKFITPHKSVMDEISKLSGMKIKSPTEAQTLFLIISCEKDLGLKLPEWAEKMYSQLQKIAALAYSYQNFDADIRKINAGYLVDKIIKDTDDKIKNRLNPGNRRIFLYSGHETTVGYLLDVFGINDDTKMPPYGSALAIEVRRKDNEYFIRLRHRDNTNEMVFHDKTLKGCENLCSFEKFVEINNDVRPSMSVEEACGLK